MPCTFEIVGKPMVKVYDHGFDDDEFHENTLNVLSHRRAVYLAAALPVHVRPASERGLTIIDDGSDPVERIHVLVAVTYWMHW